MTNILQNSLSSDEEEYFSCKGEDFDEPSTSNIQMVAQHECHPYSVAWTIQMSNTNQLNSSKPPTKIVPFKFRSCYRSSFHSKKTDTLRGDSECDLDNNNPNVAASVPMNSESKSSHSMDIYSPENTKIDINKIHRDSFAPENIELSVPVFSEKNTILTENNVETYAKYIHSAPEKHIQTSRRLRKYSHSADCDIENGKLSRYRRHSDTDTKFMQKCPDSENIIIDTTKTTLDGATPSAPSEDLNIIKLCECMEGRKDSDIQRSFQPKSTRSQLFIERNQRDFRIETKSTRMLREQEHELTLQRCSLNMKRLLCISRPQYKYSCGISSVVSVWNYLFSTLGEGNNPPISQEEALIYLGFVPPFTEIRFGPFTGNITLMKWFSRLCTIYNVQGVASMFFKPVGADRTHITEKRALKELKSGLVSSSCAFIYHSYNHYFCPIGFEITPDNPEDAYATTSDVQNLLLSDSELGRRNDECAWIFVADTSKAHPPIHSIRWSDILCDLNSVGPERLNVRKLHEGMIRRHINYAKPSLVTTEAVDNADIATSTSSSSSKILSTEYTESETSNKEIFTIYFDSEDDTSKISSIETSETVENNSLIEDNKRVAPSPLLGTELTVPTFLVPSIENLVDSSIESLVETPIKSLVESPIKSLVESPIKSLVETPIESLVETPIESLVESPIESLVETPIKSLVESPIKSLVESPIKSLVESPIESLVESPIESLVESPIAKPVRVTHPIISPMVVTALPPLSTRSKWTPVATSVPQSTASTGGDSFTSELLTPTPDALDVAERCMTSDANTVASQSLACMDTTEEQMFLSTDSTTKRPSNRTDSSNTGASLSNSPGHNRATVSTSQNGDECFRDRNMSHKRAKKKRVGPRNLHCFMKFYKLQSSNR